jgi:hypothetical protein
MEKALQQQVQSEEGKGEALVVHNQSEQRGTHQAQTMERKDLVLLLTQNGKQVCRKLPYAQAIQL